MAAPEIPDACLVKEPRRPAVLVLVVGEESLTTDNCAEKWLQACRSAVKESGVPRVLIDCSESGSVFAAGLGKLLRIYRDLHVAGGQMAMCQLPDMLQELIEITKLDRVLKLYPDRETALRALWG